MRGNAYLMQKITIFFILGLLISPFLPNFGYWLLLFIAVLFVVVIYFFHKKRHLYKIYSDYFLVLFVFVFAVFSHQINQPINQKSHYIHHIKWDEKQTYSFRIKEKLRENQKFFRYIIALESIENKPVFGKIILYVAKDSLTKEFEIGSKIFAFSAIQKIKTPQNPTLFRYDKYLYNLGIYGQIYLKKQMYFLQKEKYKDHWYYASFVREMILKNLKNNGFSEHSLSLFSALLLGQQKEVDFSTIQDFQIAGAVHILSVSGLHMGYVMMVLLFVFRPLGNQQKIRLIKLLSILTVMFGFAIITGFEASVVRSFVMYGMMALAKYKNRKADLMYVLWLSMLFLLIIRPSYLYDIGFQLSYVSVFFILWLQPVFSKWYQPKNLITKYIWGIVTVSLAAQLGTMPVCLYYFHQFSTYFLLTNLIVLPVISIVMILGFAICLLASFQLTIVFLCKIESILIWVCYQLIHFVANLKFAAITEISFDILMLGISYFAIYYFRKFLVKRQIRDLQLLLLCVFGLQLYFLSISKFYSNEEQLVFLHHPKKPMALWQKNKHVYLLTVSGADEKEKTVAEDYAIMRFLPKIEQKKTGHFFVSSNKKIMILDKLNNQIPPQKPDVVWVNGNPKCNMYRWMKTVRPKMVVINTLDKIQARSWEETLKILKIPFQNTSEKGAFCLN